MTTIRVTNVRGLNTRDGRSAVTPERESVRQVEDQSTTAAPVEYRPIPGFPGYFAGNDGTIRSEVKGKPLILRPALRGQFGYYGVQLCRDRKQYSRYVHRLVLEAFVGPCPEGMEACHGDGDPRNNRLSNLRWDTSAGNKKDQLKHGTLTRGSANGQAKLSEDEVQDVRRRVAAGERTTHVGRRYGLSQAQVKRIVRRECWAHVA